MWSRRRRIEALQIAFEVRDALATAVLEMSTNCVAG
jgi:hypothetical protein